MTLKFPSLKNLIDFLRATRTENWDFSKTRLTLTSDFLHDDIKSAMTYGATILDDTSLQQPSEVKHFSTHT
jgi:hypothetical protein